MKEKTPHLLHCHLYSADVPSFQVQMVFPTSTRLTPNRLTHKYCTKSKRSTYTCLWQRCVGDLMGFGRKQVLMNIQQRGSGPNVCFSTQSTLPVCTQAGMWAGWRHSGYMGMWKYECICMFFLSLHLYHSGSNSSLAT